MIPDSVARLALTVSDSIELAIIAKGTIVLGLALLAMRWARRARASLRHVVMASAFGMLLVLPAVVILVPPVAVPISVQANPDPAAARPFIGDPSPIRHLPRTSGSADSTQTQWRSERTVELLRVGWSGVAAIFLVHVAITLWRLLRLRRRGLPWRKGEPLLRAVAAQSGIRRSVDILRHEDIAAPLTCGVARPAIVLPLDADEWSEVDVRRAIVHELEHVRRADWPIQIGARVVCALYWFHPLVWMAWRHLCLDAERACDDAVLRGSERTEYADQLVALASRLSKGAMRPMLSMAGRSDLSARISAVLDHHQPRGRAGYVGATVTIAIAALVVFAISPLRAVTGAPLQTPSGGLAFEVASVKPNTSGELRVSLQALPGGRYVATNAPLRTLIRDAYALQDLQLVGGPGWLDSDRFDIVAKAEGDATPEQKRLMLRTLLADRFKLRVHGETRDVLVYALVMARGDGRLGPRLRRTGTDCAQAPEWAGTGPPPARDPDEPCRSLSPGSGGGMRFRGITLDAFAKFLATPARRPVIDRTGQTGDFDIELELTAELGPPPPPPGVPDRVDRTSAPSIFTALQEQLGLKLDSQRGPVEVLVIDHVELLVPN